MRFPRVKILILLQVSVGLLSGSILLGQVTGDLRMHTLNSRVFENSRQLRVWLPPGYEDPGSREQLYPVLYLNDGQNLFDKSTAQFSEDEWQVDETVMQMIEANEIPPLIVVGIDNAGKSGRPNEYLPWEDVYLSPPCPDPQGSKYPVFLEQEVIPFIEKHYRARRDPGSKMLGGSSYGGLITLYSATALPGTFGGILVESPSIYVDEARLLQENQDFTAWPARIYLGVGTHEGKSSCTEERNQEAVSDVLLLEELVRKNCPDSRVKVVVEECGMHGEEAWARRLPGALRFLFGKTGE